jgi:hypothetical protein
MVSATRPTSWRTPALARGRAQLSVQIFAGDDVGGRHRPVLRNLHVLLLEQDLAFGAGDLGYTQLPLNFVIGRNAEIGRHPKPNRNRNRSFAPSGLVPFLQSHPRLAPWAAFFRRSAAAFCLPLWPPFSMGHSYAASRLGRAKRLFSIPSRSSRIGRLVDTSTPISGPGLRNRRESAMVAQFGPVYLMIQTAPTHLPSRQKQRLKPQSKLRHLRHD